MRIVIEIDDKGAASAQVTQVTPAPMGVFEMGTAVPGGSASDAGPAPRGPDAAGALSTVAAADTTGTAHAAGAAPPL